MSWAILDAPTISPRAFLIGETVSGYVPTTRASGVNPTGSGQQVVGAVLAVGRRREVLPQAQDRLAGIIALHAEQIDVSGLAAGCGQSGH
jgi:hypothetical protein